MCWQFVCLIFFIRKGILIKKRHWLQMVLYIILPFGDLLSRKMIRNCLWRITPEMYYLHILRLTEEREGWWEGGRERERQSERAREIKCDRSGASKCLNIMAYSISETIFVYYPIADISRGNLFTVRVIYCWTTAKDYYQHIMAMIWKWWGGIHNVLIDQVIQLYGGDVRSSIQHTLVA